jgi:hypothetical protein
VNVILDGHNETQRPETSSANIIPWVTVEFKGHCNTHYCVLGSP